MQIDSLPDSSLPDSQPALPDNTPIEHRLQFTGTGGEYFRIWIVNLLLSILTFGIYSAWAKVRREQYFHRNTLLDGSGFDYHGDPKAIFKGRVIAVVFLAILSLVDETAHTFYYPLLLIVSPLIPWLIIRSLIFRCRNTSFRGLHFNFIGTYKGLCKAYIVPILAIIALSLAVLYAAEQAGVKMLKQKDDSMVFYLIILFIFGAVFSILLLISMLVYRLKAFQFNHLVFGVSRFESRFRLKSFYGIYLRITVLLPLLSALIFVPIYIIAFIIAGHIESISGAEAAKNFFIFIIGLMSLAISISSQTWFTVLQNNLIWNKTSLDKHSFKSDQTFWSLFRIVFSNFLLMLITLGLYWPWAKVKIARYRTEHTAVLAMGNLDDFVAGATQEKSAIGEEVADIFDFDITL